jgi:L-iditol 2-dehydrogenase
MDCKMQAVFQHGPRDLRPGELPIPIPGPGEVLIKVAAVTICGSDIHAYTEGNISGIQWDQPFVPGHEVAGPIVDANGTPLTEGTPVVLDPAASCFDCYLCNSGWYHVCRNQRFLDLPPVHGGLREYVAWPANRVFPVPPEMDLSVAPLIEPLAVAVHAVELAANVTNATVLVVGCGAIGLCTFQVAKARGAARVIAVDLIPERLQVASELGADLAINASEGTALSEILAATDGAGVDLAFEAAGPQVSLELGLQAVHPTGEVVVIGIPTEDEYHLSSADLRRREMTLKFVRRQNENFPEAIRLVEHGRVQLAPMLTHRFPLSQAKEAFDLAERKGDGAIRVAVLP